VVSYEVGDDGLISRMGWEFFLRHYVKTQPTIHWVPGLHPEIKAAEEWSRPLIFI